MIAKVSGFVLQKGVRMGIDCLAGFQGKGRGGRGSLGRVRAGRRMGRGGGAVVMYVILFSFGGYIFLILLRNSCGIVFFNRFLEMLRRKSKLLPIFSYEEIRNFCVYANSEII